MADWDEKAVFLHALGLPPSEREAYMEQACPDEQARDRIRTLLLHHDAAADDFLTSTKSTDEAHSRGQIDEFKILHRLGEGGMGIVYLAEDTVLGRRVALKVLAQHMTGSEQALARFREEARSAAALKHHAIVPVFKFGRDGNDHYLVSEYVEGRTLADLIAEKRRTMSVAGSQDVRAWYRQVAEIIATIADALDCAHRARIVHRDVKPSNILIDSERGPRLTDFGIAKHLTEETRSQQQATGLIGSCHYMSPEQACIATASVDHRSDIFSLGVVMYELLSLRLPFEGGSIPMVLRAVSECAPQRVRSVDRRIPVDLETICHKAMEKLPKDRYQTAAHVAADLRCYLLGDPILARPPSRARQCAIWLRNHRVAIYLGTLITLLASVIMLGYALRAKKIANMARLKINANRDNLQVFAKHLSPSNGNREALLLGLTPIQEIHIEPGNYYLSICGSDSVFCDATVYLPKPDHGSTPETVFVTVFKTADLDDTDMVLIAGGEFRPGRVVDSFDQDRANLASGSIDIDSFWIDRYEVSNAKYLEFIKATGWRMPSHWKRGNPTENVPGNLLNYPVVGITANDAAAYAHWCGKRLPTEWEWEYAVSRDEHGSASTELLKTARPLMISPEDELAAKNPDQANQLRLYEKYCMSVMSESSDKTALGIFHARANVSEMTCSVWLSQEVVAVACGGSWYQRGANLQLSDRSTFLLGASSIRRGFRCVRPLRPLLGLDTTH